MAPLRICSPLFCAASRAKYHGQVDPVNAAFSVCACLDFENQTSAETGNPGMDVG
jgi:hypothetical protein